MLLRPPRRGPFRRVFLALPLVCLLGAFARPSAAAMVPDDFADEDVVTGLDQPSNFDMLPDGRVLLVEQRSARLRLVVGDSLAGVDPVGVIEDVEAMGPEQGLLGVAVDPRWPDPPYVYVFHSVASTPNLRLSRYRLEGDVDLTGDGSLTLDPASRRDILADVPDDYPLHNGGTIEFGPDGMLYVAIGEDGVPCSAPDVHQLRGKILRLNVMNVPAGPGAAPSYQSLAAPANPWAEEADPRARVVWHRGLRNPYTFEFDAFTGEMLIADVGSADFEEIDLVAGGGHNFGWPLYEGPRRFDYPCDYSDSGTVTGPAFWYQRSNPGVEAAVMVGAVYRKPPGATVGFPPGYEGDVFMYDLYEGALRRLVRFESTLIPAPPVPGQPTVNAWATGLKWSTRMRIGPDGGLWYFDEGQSLRRIVHTGDLVGAPAPMRAALLLRAGPVPFHGAVRLDFDLPAPGTVGIAVVDVAGRRVRSLLARADLAAGPGSVTWDGRDDAGRSVPAGVYLAVVQVGGRSATARLVRLGG